ncbi:hypothetical protein MAPG_01940 [Magnaporthiopsis poae ATCC 64411]|uniref:Major facilitator superfamily (MFS) profile domain-containing protein n=1 Tax=Magnaporthiopsis poae (strain ATCC 64411 / 73-15) TaxID=644358 RepID=A0A0C4DQ08_MAGP6|nr:hypothetical protein MAPG_01940 [Magnaporthiopsis poae ATCC 64411]
MEKIETDVSNRQVEKAVPDGRDDDAAADRANAAETSLSMREAFRLYWKAVAWSVCVSNATIMESYMLLLTGSFYAQPQFQQRFGELLPGGRGEYSIPAQWQVGVSMAGLAGLIGGSFSNGYFADRFGQRRVMIVSHMSLVAFVFILFFAPDIKTIMIGTLFLAIPCGFFASGTPTYAAEVTPLRLRGYMTVYVNLCWVIGRLVAYSILAGTLSMQSEWAYRVPFAIQWAWPVPLAIATWLAPESPCSFYLSIGNAGLALVGNLVSWALMARFGWRSIYLGGLLAMIPVMGLVAFLDLAATGSDAVRWGQCSLLLVWFFIYGASIGPVPYGIAANVGAASLRPKTIAIGRNMYYVLNIANTIVTPYMLNPAQFNLKGRAAFLPWVLTLLMVVWTYFRLPELKGLTQDTINHLFETRVPARRFAEKGRECQG